MINLLYIKIMFLDNLLEYLFKRNNFIEAKLQIGIFIHTLNIEVKYTDLIMV